MSDGAPCFDPTCDCCRCWSALDDARIAEIDRLRELIVIATRTVLNGITTP